MDNFWKNKKILLYIALGHHTRFILPATRLLEKKGARTQYVIGQAERSQEITAIEYKLDYQHVFNYLEPDDFQEIQKNYMLVRETFASGLTTDFALGSQVLTVTDKTLYSTAMEYVAFRKCLEKEKPDICMALHEVNRWGKIMAFRAKQLNIPFITLQEGLNYGLDFHHIGHVQYGTLDLVWGNRVRKMLSDYEAPADRIIPVGNTHISNEISHQKKNGTRQKMKKKYHSQNKNVILLLISSSIPPAKDFESVFRVIAEEKKLCLMVKFHPATKKKNIEKWIQSIKNIDKERFHFIHAEESTYDLISMSDICVIPQPSTTGLESLAFGKPLIQLTDITIRETTVYSFIEKGVALGLSAEDFAQALKTGKDFTGQIPEENIKKYLADELYDTQNVAERMVKILETTITANQDNGLPALKSEIKKPLKDWTIILPVCEAPDIFLTQLESIATCTGDNGSFEVILLEPPTLSGDIQKIVNSLEGDLKRVIIPSDCTLWDAMNEAGCKAEGERLCFLSRYLAPNPGWLLAIDNAMKAFPKAGVFGGKIINRFNNVVHAGVVLNVNNQPISAYLHLDKDFPQANLERPFQMVDDFIAIKRKDFLKSGGFWPGTGPYAFLDICLRFQRKAPKSDNVIYVPKATFISLAENKKNFDPQASFRFYGKWHGMLWDSEDALYEKDGITTLQLEAARMTRAIEIASSGS